MSTARKNEIPSNLNVSGVYMFINKINNKKYIGSSLNIHLRILKHFSDVRMKKKNGKTLNYFQKALLKYRKDNFDILVLEQVNFYKQLNKKEKASILIQLEQKYLDLYKTYKRDSGYNTLMFAGTPLGYSHTEETKRKIIENRTPIVYDDEIRKNISEAQKKRFEKETPYWKGKKRDFETNEMIKNKLATNIIQLDLNKNIINYWRSAREAARELSTPENKFTNSEIGRCCSGENKTHKGFMWMYESNYLKEVST